MEILIINPLFQRADGFYHADVNGQLGLVPGSFLDEYTNGVRYERFKENYVFFLFVLT